MRGQGELRFAHRHWLQRGIELHKRVLDHSMRIVAVEASFFGIHLCSPAVLIEVDGTTASSLPNLHQSFLTCSKGLALSNGSKYSP
jgi:hypothetical protein